VGVRCHSPFGFLTFSPIDIRKDGNLNLFPGRGTLSVKKRVEVET
jgi:hypothetical protein